MSEAPAICAIAKDKSSRSVDAYGRMHVLRSNISKADVNTYLGREVIGWKDLGLDPDQFYRILRPAEELEKAAESFVRIPILMGHSDGAITADAPLPDMVVGSTGSDVGFSSPYLYADTVFWDSSAIAGIETGQIREFSIGYGYTAVMEPGEHEGKPYEGKMTQIKGNHLALVEVGRAGADVIVADHDPFKKEDKLMKMTKTGKALFTAVCAAYPTLGKDAATASIFAEAGKGFPRDKAIQKLLALDASIDQNKTNDILQTILDMEEEEKEDRKAEKEPAKKISEDASVADKIESLLAGKVSDSIIKSIVDLIEGGVWPQKKAHGKEETAGEKKDNKQKAEGGNEGKGKGSAEDEDIMDRKDVKLAMDSLRKELLDAEEARRVVRPVVGDVVGMDSAESVYGFALDNLKVDREGVTGVKALRALYKVASTVSREIAPTIARDSSTIFSKFPEAKRFIKA